MMKLYVQPSTSVSEMELQSMIMEGTLIGGIPQGQGGEGSEIETP